MIRPKTHARLDPRPQLEYRVGHDDWRDRAACAGCDVHAFVPAKGENIPNAAKRICQGCDVRAECLQFALDLDIREGMYGGTTPTQRRKIRKKGGVQRERRIPPRTLG